MKVQNINNTSTPNFGMSLHVDLKSIEREFDSTVSNGIKPLIPSLQKIAEDVDVFIKPASSPSTLYGINDVIKVVVQKKDISLFDKLKSKLGITPPYKKRVLVSPSSVRTIGYLEEATTIAKNSLLSMQ